MILVILKKEVFFVFNKGKFDKFLSSSKLIDIYKPTERRDTHLSTNGNKLIFWRLGSQEKKIAAEPGSLVDGPHICCSRRLRIEFTNGIINYFGKTLDRLHEDEYSSSNNLNDSAV